MDSEESLNIRQKGNNQKISKPAIKLGNGLFKDAGAIPARKDICNNCKEPSADMFKCNKDTKHLKCSNCQLLFPERNQYDQQCYSCDRYFCNLYWDCENHDKNLLFNPVTSLIFLSYQLARLQDHKVNLFQNRFYAQWNALTKKSFDDFLKREKLTLLKLTNEIYAKHLRDMQFDREQIPFKKQGNEGAAADNAQLKVLPITPICKECALYIQIEMLRQHLDNKNGKVFKENDEEEKKEEDKESQSSKKNNHVGGVNRNYAKAKNKFL